MDLYFDVVTGLLRREVTTTETMLLPLQEQVESNPIIRPRQLIRLLSARRRRADGNGDSARLRRIALKAAAEGSILRQIQQEVSGARPAGADLCEVQHEPVTLERALDLDRGSTSLRERRTVLADLVALTYHPIPDMLEVEAEPEHQVFVRGDRR
jgi:hypothetical protein